MKTALGFLDEPGPKWFSSLPHSHGASAFRSRRCQGSRSLARTRSATAMQECIWRETTILGPAARCSQDAYAEDPTSTTVPG